MTVLPSLSSKNRLQRRFFGRPPATVASDLLGQWLVRVSDAGEVIGGRITETEAYLATGDPASHSFSGPGRRNRSMFARPGTLYVYSIHAKYCMNVSTESSGIGSAVLIRAMEPLWGLESMAVARGHEDLRRLTRGPAMLCQALGITTMHDGLDLITLPWLAILRASRLPLGEIISGPRIGISRGQQLPLRFHIRGTRFASR